MEELPDRRTLQIESADGRPPEAGQPTDQLERETVASELPRITNDSEVQPDPRSQNTIEFINDYERVLPPHYKLVRMLGRGGMAEVFLALDERLNRSVAIKFLNSEFRRDPERMRRFHGEARAASALNHPNILIIHDIGENDGIQFIVSEYVQGETLTKRMAKGRMSLGEALDIAAQIASALSASHRAGIVHRDVKPDNIMVRRDGSVKVLDFGLAKETGENFYSPNNINEQTIEGVATSPGLILGTPQYMSPEQARGLRLDARTDIFSLGIILYEMLTGENPFPGSSLVDVIASILGKEPRKLSEIVEGPPEALERLVRTALQKDRADRYSSMDEFLADLKSLRGVHSGPHDIFDTQKTRNRATRENTVGAVPPKRSIPWNLLILAIVVIPLLFLIVTLFKRNTNTPVISSSMRSVPITSWSSGTGELVAAASFSPDGNMIAFAATKTGATEIWVKPVVGGEPIQVTKSGFYNQYPVWAPDNRQIAFFSSRDGANGIWRVSFAGGDQLQLASGIGGSARPVMWSKSGKVFYQEGNELFTADEQTGERKQITDFAAKGLKPRTIQVSRDEKLVAYSIKDGDQWRLRLADIKELPGRDIATSKNQIDQVGFHPDGRTVIFSSANENAYQVFRTSIDHKVPEALSTGEADLFVQDISPDGESVLYGSVIETSDLWMVNVADGKQSAAVNDVATEFWAAFSPDGKSIAYQSVAQPDRPFRGAVKTVTVGTENPVLISLEGYSPTWSPDGNWLAYFKRSDAGVSIWTSRATGGDARKIGDGAISPPGYLATPYLKIGIGHISWSPDSSQIAYTAKVEGKAGVWLSTVDGSRSAAIAEVSGTDGTICCPVWSPVGSAIVYVSDLPRPSPDKPGLSRLIYVDVSNSSQRVLHEFTDRFRPLGFLSDGKSFLVAQRADPKSTAAITAVTDIYEVSVLTGEKAKVSSLENAYFHNIHLSHDGRNIAFVSRKDDISTIWILSVKGGVAKRLTVENDPKILISSLAWSPDGRSILFGKQTRTNMLSMLSK